MSEVPRVDRTPWGYDPDYERCEPFDSEGRHLGSVWFERVRNAMADRSTRRNWLAKFFSLPALLLVKLFDHRAK